MTASIDKIKMFLPRTGTTPDIVPYLENPAPHILRDTGEIMFQGKVDKMTVRSYPSGISIIGSLPKFLNGNNILPMDVGSIVVAFEKLSDALHISVQDAIITYIEYGANLITRKQPEVYLRKLGNMPRMQRYQFAPNSLYYQSQGKHPSMKFSLYDKGMQVGERVLEEYGLEGVNVLRVEDRRNGRLRQQLKVPEVSVATLQDKGFNRMMAAIFADRYFSINKHKQITLNMNTMNNIKTPKDAEMAFFSALNIENVDEHIAAFINELKANKVFRDRREYSRTVKRIERTLSFADPCAEDEDIVELDDEIRNASAYL